MDAKCQIEVSDGSRWPTYHKCGRKVVGTLIKWGKETPACNMHIKAAERAAKKAEEEWEVREASHQNREAAKVMIARLAKHGINAGAHFATSTLSYTGQVVVSVEDMEKLLAVYEEGTGA